MILAPAALGGDALQDLLTFHRSIRAALVTLDEVADSAENGFRCDPYKAAALYDFFTGPLRLHDRDERESLFPRLARVYEPSSEDMLRAAAEHEHLERVLQDVLGHLQDIARSFVPGAATLLRFTAQRMHEILDEHMEHEERVVFPIARKMLTPGDLDAMKAEMTARHASQRRLL